jgi:lipoate-protein ligase A
VSRLRARTDVVVIERLLTAPLLVLGSTQTASLASDLRSVDLVRRRGGGGAVMLIPSDVIWIDLWLPAASQRSDDVRALLGDAGAHFESALAALGVEGLEPWHQEHASERAVACFAGLGHGELVDSSSRKFLGLTAWRCRDGALVQAALYRRRDTSLLTLLELDEIVRRRLEVVLDTQVTDLETMAPSAATNLMFGRDLAEALVERTGGVLERRPPEIEP